jgi:nitrogen fixation-related uncharacterized protein
MEAAGEPGKKRKPVLCRHTIENIPLLWEGVNDLVVLRSGALLQGDLNWRLLFLALMMMCSYLAVPFSARDRLIVMAIPLAALIVILVALGAGALALSAFIWAVRTKQFSIQQLNEGAYLIFDEREPAGIPQDMIFETRRQRASSSSAAQPTTETPDGET